MAVNWSCRRRCNSMKSCCLHAVNLGQKIAFDPPYSLIPWNCVNCQDSCCWIWARINITWYDHNGIEIVRCSKYILYGNWKIPCLSFLVSMTGSIWWQESDSRRRRMFIFQSTCKCIRILQYLETSQNWQKVNKAMATRKPVVEATPTGYFGNGVKELNFKYLSWNLTISDF